MPIRPTGSSRPAIPAGWSRPGPDPYAKSFPPWAAARPGAFLWVRGARGLGALDQGGLEIGVRSGLAPGREPDRPEHLAARQEPGLDEVPPLVAARPRVLQLVLLLELVERLDLLLRRAQVGEDVDKDGIPAVGLGRQV